MSAIGPAIIPATGRASSRTALVGSYAMSYFCGGIFGNPLLFVKAGGVDSIGLSTEQIALLTVDQQAFLTDATWPDFATFWADVSVQSWFNDENIIGTETKGVWVGAESTSRYDLNKVLVWFGLPPILVYAFDPNEEIMIGPDETPVEAI